MDDVVARLRRDRNGDYLADADLQRQFVEFGAQLSEPLGGVVHQIDLVHRGDDVRHPDERGDPRVPPRLALHAVPRVDQHDRDVGVRRTGERVARVALVSRGVGEDVAAVIGGEEPVRDVDRDALFAFAAQPVRERGQVKLPLVVGDRVDVIGRQAPGVVQDAADQRRLAVIDASDGCQAEELPVVGRPVGGGS
ncbi:hypothetical protein GOARA_058_00150 [Gordonia araii NBRC 100433]|uniref:Uncharacterized protein n=1 Tax=Gordonia araii NBRC 100433 TaxID=1073574 RepID=G7H3V7_9ACTN|nr:hypothetical protein GOARA_058_00150 [Gordonia araii NBRC 100433]